MVHRKRWAHMLTWTAVDDLRALDAGPGGYIMACL